MASETWCLFELIDTDISINTSRPRVEKCLKLLLFCKRFCFLHFDEISIRHWYQANDSVINGDAHNNCKFCHHILLYPRPTKLEGGYTGFTLSVCPSVRLSVRPSVCRRHGFRSISQVCFGISISNFICMLMVAIGRSLLIFSDGTFKMAAWRPYWIFWFPDSNLTLALNINFKLQRHNTYVYG